MNKLLAIYAVAVSALCGWIALQWPVDHRKVDSYSRFLIENQPLFWSVADDGSKQLTVERCALVSLSAANGVHERFVIRAMELNINTWRNNKPANTLAESCLEYSSEIVGKARELQFAAGRLEKKSCQP